MPVAKLTTARQAVAVCSECLEAFGGAGYVEDTGLPVLLRDAQVLTIWEGTTSVLALDTLRALGAEGTREALLDEVERCAVGVRHPGLVGAAEAARDAVDHATAWLLEAGRRGMDSPTVQAGARRFALTLGHALELVLLARHAEWALEHDGDERSAAAARRLAAVGVNRVTPEASFRDAGVLAGHVPRPDVGK